jgi:hypothetical protein
VVAREPVISSTAFDLLDRQFCETRAPANHGDRPRRLQDFAGIETPA